MASFFFWSSRVLGFRIHHPFQGPLTHLCDLEAGYGGVWAPNFGGAAQGFEPGTSLSQECNDYATGAAAPLLRANVSKNLQKHKYTCSSFNFHGSGYNLTPDFPHLWDLKCPFLQDEVLPKAAFLALTLFLATLSHQ